ncbi:MAG: zf-HC2 domain-containing protein, partial [Gorillibacterium sp.]|nr:zf-HC2 domain-containing protein [Gorillibacterium sp.]
MNCEEALHHMHEYLDKDLDHVEAVSLKKHMLSCPECNRHFRELEMTEALIKNTTWESAPQGLTERIMSSLPVRPKRQSWFRWTRRHPAISVASVFLFVMLGSFLSMWNQNPELTVRGSNLDQLVIGDDMVYLPKGNHVEGNLMVRGGTVKIDGQLDGNLVIVDGSFQTASAANVSGKIYEINQAAEWLV